MNVVSDRDEGARGICQKLLLASSLEKIFAPVICAKVSSTVGSGWTSRLTDLLSGLRSTHMRSFPFFLGATTMPAHQGVGSDTLDITPAFSIRSNSCLTFGRNGKGTCLGV